MWITEACLHLGVGSVNLHGSEGWVKKSLEVESPADDCFVSNKRWMAKIQVFVWSAGFQHGHHGHLRLLISLLFWGNSVVWLFSLQVFVCSWITLTLVSMVNYNLQYIPPQNPLNTHTYPPTQSQQALISSLLLHSNKCVVRAHAFHRLHSSQWWILCCQETD